MKKHIVNFNQWQKINEQSNNDMSQELTNKLGTPVNYIDSYEEDIDDNDNEYIQDIYELPDIDNSGLLVLSINRREYDESENTFQFFYDSTPIPVPNINTKDEAIDMMQALNPYPVSLEYLKPELLDWIKRWVEPDEDDSRWEEWDENQMDFDEVLNYMKN